MLKCRSGNSGSLMWKNEENVCAVKVLFLDAIHAFWITSTIILWLKSECVKEKESLPNGWAIFQRPFEWQSSSALPLESRKRFFCLLLVKVAISHVFPFQRKFVCIYTHCSYTHFICSVEISSKGWTFHNTFFNKHPKKSILPLTHCFFKINPTIDKVVSEIKREMD